MNKSDQINDELSIFVLEKFYSLCLKEILKNFNSKEKEKNLQNMEKCHSKISNAFKIISKIQKSQETLEEGGGDV